MGLFGFLKKGSEEKADPQVQEVMLQDLADWFETARAAELKDMREKAEKMHNSLADSFSDIKEKLDAMDRARITGIERLHISANMIKETFVKKKYPPLREVSSFRENFRHDYGYFMAFQEKTMQVLDNLKGSTPKQTILLSRYFKKESHALVDAMKHAEQTSKQFRDFLKTGSGALRTLARIRVAAKSSRQLLEEVDNLDIIVRGLKSQITKSSERKSGLEHEYLKLLKSKDWSRINKLTKEVDEAREDMRQADVRLNTELSSLRKPLKKIEHVMVNRGELSPIHKNNLRDFMRNPFKATIASKGDAGMAKTMDAVKKQLENLGVSTEHDIDSLRERFGKDVPKLRELYIDQRDILEKKQEELDELSRLTSNKQGIENEVKASSEQAGSLEEQLRKTRAEQAHKQQQARDTIKELEAVIRDEAQRFVKIRMRAA